MHGQNVAFHTGDFRDLRDLSRSALQASGLHHQLNGGGDLPAYNPNRQIKRVYSPVGSNEVLSFDALLIAAGNSNLETDVRMGKFRSDLYHRLNVIEFSLEPLRGRTRIIHVLAERFLDEFARSFERPLYGISREAARRLEAYQWPGNIRELRNVMQRIVALCTGPLIQIEDLPQTINEVAPSLAPSTSHTNPTHHLAEAKKEAESALIEEALRRNGNNRRKTAAELGISRMTLYNKMHRYGFLPQS